MEKSNVVEVEREYADFSVRLRTGSRRKQELSNNLTIEVPGRPVTTNVTMTLRQARALKKFLNDNDI